MVIRSGGVGISRREPCIKCGLPVFLAERLNVNNYLYHRTCFRCARCSNQLSLANYYETEDGQFCCETCPDEENLLMDSVDSPDKQKVLSRSLSDEEKQQGLQKFEHIERSSFSTSFESALDSSKNVSGFTKARNSFMATQLMNDEENEDFNLDEKPPPELPSTKPPDKIIEHENYGTSLTSCSDNNGEDPCSALDVNINLDGNVNRSDVPNINKLDDATHDLNVNKVSSDKCSDRIDQPLTTNNQLVISNDSDFDKTDFVTKEANTVTVDKSSKSRTSLVQLRMQMFESKDISTENSKISHENSDSINSDSKQNIYDNFSENTEVLEIDKNKVPSNSCTNSTTSELVSEEYVTVRSDNSSRDQIENINVNKTDDAETMISIPPHTEVDNLEISNNAIIESSNAQISDNIQTTSTPLTDYPVELNPFSDDEDTGININEKCRKLIKVPADLTKSINKNNTMSTTTTKSLVKNSTNPFDSCSDEETTSITSTNYIPVPSPRKSTKTVSVKKVIKANLNPFSSEDDSDNEEIERPVRPVPKPRLTPVPKRIDEKNNDTLYGSSTSLSSVTSSSTQTPSSTYRKKKPAPPPPTMKEVFQQGESVENESINFTLIKTPKGRKSRIAPLPPTSTPAANALPLNVTGSPIIAVDERVITYNSPAKSIDSNEWEKEKTTKDEQNRNRQSFTASVNISPTSESDISTLISIPNKSTYGKWKRKKGPAPARPVPQRRQIKTLPATELRRQLDDIEVQQQGLEKQGVKLEQLIREKCEVPGADEDSPISIEVEDMVLQLFELVNEKNELFRKQAELMYLRRQQRLEEEHADLEYQIRCLMDQPERNKTDSDKAREEELINRLIDVVERRNEIVECLEMDRIREAEEDHSINTQLNKLAAKREEETTTTSPQTPTKLSKKEKKKLKKEKKTKGNISRDADKDIDETEDPVSKEPKKKKWFLHM